MNILDVFILMVIAWALWKGWKSGLFREAASLVGFIVGLFLAGMLYGWLGNHLAPRLGTSPTFASVLAFIILWVAVPVTLGILARFVSKAVNHTCLGGLNRLGGAGISFLKYTLLISCMVNVMSFIHLLDDQKQSQESLLYTPTKAFVGWSFRHLFAPSDASKSGNRRVNSTTVE
jgi:membrane protein required for colicin V production